MPAHSFSPTCTYTVAIYVVVLTQYTPASMDSVWAKFVSNNPLPARTLMKQLKYMQLGRQFDLRTLLELEAAIITCRHPAKCPDIVTLRQLQSKNLQVWVLLSSQHSRTPHTTMHSPSTASTSQRVCRWQEQAKLCCSLQSPCYMLRAESAK